MTIAYPQEAASPHARDQEDTSLELPASTAASSPPYANGVWHDDVSSPAAGYAGGQVYGMAQANTHVLNPSARPFQTQQPAHLVDTQLFPSPGQSLSSSQGLSPGQGPFPSQGLSSGQGVSSDQSVSPGQVTFYSPGPSASQSHTQAVILPPTSNYRGDPNTPENQCADIPSDQNVSRFVAGLPPNCTINMLLGSIREIGKVYSSNMVPPDSSFGYSTAGAKIVFWDRAGAHRLDDLWGQGDWYVGTYMLILRPNRIRMAEHVASRCSRVLVLHGPSCIVDRHYLTAFFQRLFTFDMNDVVVIIEDQVHKVRKLEYRFASYRCQAQFAEKWCREAKHGRQIPWAPMSLVERQAWRQVKISWGSDPCA
ncbi:Uu.00g043570.m01.CDS01 [Anthostomella pinea]|uniref:Uu.00g043570.m01.CDS01 n=1 Tax=Anthostomella pinea TaxID=933095 RepID=A0AAI8VAP9_9PEZI|nr:Uu.00g043570.m01.CDS01 [Anthostomella pinea]